MCLVAIVCCDRSQKSLPACKDRTFLPLAARAYQNQPGHFGMSGLTDAARFSCGSDGHTFPAAQASVAAAAVVPDQGVARSSSPAPALQECDRSRANQMAKSDQRASNADALKRGAARRGCLTNPRYAHPSRTNVIPSGGRATFVDGCDTGRCWSAISGAKTTCRA